MARSLYLFLLLAALTLCHARSAGAEPGTPPPRASFVDPYYARRAQAHGITPGGVAATPGVATAQYENQGAFRPSLMNPFAETESEVGEFGAAEGMVDGYEPGAAVDGGYGDETCGDDTCGHDACGDGGCDAGLGGGFGGLAIDPCHSGYRVWANFDYLNWKVHGDGIPPLLTTSTPGTSQSDAGVLGEPNTSVLFGNERLNNDQRSGGRFQIGMWLDPEGYTAVEGYYYALETASQDFAAASTFSTPFAVNQQILARPFHNIFDNFNDSLVLAFPDFDIGGVTVNLDGQFNAREWSNVQSAGALFRQLWKCGSHCNQTLNHRVYMIGGYRFFRLAENLQINHAIEPDDPFPAGTRFTSHDEFDTRNYFHGADLGMINEFRWWRLSVESVLKVAVGNMHQELNISGFSTTSDGAVLNTREGGLLALPTNIGHFNRDRLALIPEVEVKFGLQITPGIRATIGYDFTYVSRVMRPGHQLDLTINPTQRAGVLVGPARPLPVLESADVFLQGLTAGFEFRY